VVLPKANVIAVVLLDISIVPIARLMLTVTVAEVFNPVFSIIAVS
jgi:hypothetical protein